MLCRKIKQAIIANPTLKTNVPYNCLLNYRYFSRRCFILESILTAASKSEGRVAMSSFRLMFRDLNVRRLWNAWTRSYLVNTVVKRIKRDRGVREVIQCFRHNVLRPRTFLLSTTAAFKANDGDSDKPPSCGQSITDEELEALVHELETVEQLSKSTLFCAGCGKRVIIDKKLPGVRYCVCKDVPPPEDSFDGWQPYMEAEDVIIWRKEYKEGQGLYAYKVYGRYRDVKASDFAAIQVDGAYRRVWDAAVAALSVVERHAQGVRDQAVLHWEVLWPRLFANRDYVYIRRHKDFEVADSASLPHKEGLFEAPPIAPPPEERPSVHSHAKRKAMENEMREKIAGTVDENKVFVIISRSCEHPDVPESKNAIRVSEYWSHMVVRSLHGVDKPGMEFVLTYYDEPAVGGLPTGVAAWATGRAAPAYLERMRKAAGEYPEWRNVKTNQELPDFVSFNQTKGRCPLVKLSEQDMESSKEGPELNESSEDSKRDQGTQTEAERALISDSGDKQREDSKAVASDQIKESNQTKVDTTSKESPKEPIVKNDETKLERDNEKPEEEDSNNTNTGYWWRDDEEDNIFLIP